VTGPREIERMLLEAVARRYGGRDPSMVAVHELLHPAIDLPRLRRPASPGGADGFIVVGEAVERGIRDLLSAEVPPRVVVPVPVDADAAPPRVLAALAEAGVRLDGGVLHVTGQADLVVAGDPEARIWEVKTTRSSRWRSYKSKWVAQAKLYSALYGEPVRLVVVNLNSGDGFVQTFVYSEPRTYLARVVRRWLAGEPFPWA